MCFHNKCHTSHKVGEHEFSLLPGKLEGLVKHQYESKGGKPSPRPSKQSLERFVFHWRCRSPLSNGRFPALAEMAVYWAGIGKQYETSCEDATIIDDFEMVDTWRQYNKDEKRGSGHLIDALLVVEKHDSFNFECLRLFCIVSSRCF